MSSSSSWAARHVGGCLSLMLLAVAGCNTTIMHKPAGSKPTSVQTGSVAETTPVRPVDLQPLAKRSAAAVIKRSAEFTQGKTPVLYVDMLRNNTGTTLDLTPATTVLHTELARSGRFKLIPLEKNAAFQQSLEYQQSEGALNPSTAVQLGKQTGATMMLYGHVSRIKKSKTYQLTTNMMDLKSGELLFSDKQSSRAK
jgi:uncharacterized protein (TIGR02722 family)